MLAGPLLNGTAVKMKYVIASDHVSFLDHYFFEKPKLIPEADPATFKPIGEWFGADCQHVYFLYNVVSGADPESFIYLGGYNCQWARDRRCGYFFWPTRAARRWNVLESQSPASFRIVPDCGFCEYAQDNQNVFFLGKKIRAAGADSFHIMTMEKIEDGSTLPSHLFSEDAAHVYFEGRAIKDVDHKLFKVLRAQATSHTEYGTDGSMAVFKDHARTKMVTLPHANLPLSIRDYFSSHYG
jgi:hypothetical protein